MSADVIFVHLVAHYQRFIGQVQYIIGNVFQMGNNSINLTLPLQITRNYDDQNSFRSLPIVCMWYMPLLEQVKNHSS